MEDLTKATSNLTTKQNEQLKNLQHLDNTVHAVGNEFASVENMARNFGSAVDKTVDELERFVQNIKKNMRS